MLASAGAAALLTASPAFAQIAPEPTTELDEVIVTGTLRGATNVQDTPINIAAVGGAQIERQGLTDLTEIARYVPGVYLVDQGPRNASRIIVRGLNIDPLGESVGQGAGGTVATYIGNVPISVDLKLNDIQRVEFLLGPQGTLYGAGTLGGAIRYIPNSPSFDAFSGQIRGDAYGYSEGDDVSTDFGLTVNLPISDTLAFRASMDQLNDQGFIDMPFLVNEIGVTNPNDFSAGNLRREDDVNTEDVLSGRAALRWKPTDWFDATLSYNYQDSDVGGRQVTGRRVTTLPVEVGEYEAVQRIREPNQRTSDLTALEMEIDLGFAALTSATGYQTFESDGRRDQTDLLISLQYSYEFFPGFSAYTQELEDNNTWTQELRLTSKPDSGPLSWIVGGYYSKNDYWNSSAEYTPGYPEYLGGERPDNLEYISVSYGKVTETALFGELTWQITPAWQITGGARHYTYKLETSSATDLPLLESVFYGRDPTSIVLDFESSGDKEDGWLYKLNTSYAFTDDILFYGTISDGFRSGGSNNLTLCAVPADPGQNVCAQPDEQLYTSEKTRNYEIGVKTQWFDKRLTVNGDIFYIDWEDPQVSGATLVGLSPITRNGSGAATKGFEVSFNSQITDAFSLRGSYSYTKAELTDDAPNLITAIVGTGPRPYDTFYVDGEDGDRLPGSPESQFSLFANYEYPLSNGMTLDFGYGVTASGDVLTRTGGRGGGVTLDGYDLHTASVRLNAPDAGWAVTAYVNNLWDEFAETGARSTPSANQVLENDEGGPVYARNHFTNVLPPRVIGIRFTKDFGG